MSFSIIIPSRNIDNLRTCIGAIKNNGCKARIIVVWDGDVIQPLGWVPSDVNVAQGDKPFIFSRNVNIGIRATGEDDVLILNDDSVLCGGNIDFLSSRVRENPSFGAVSAAIQGSFQPEQLPKGIGLRVVNFHTIAFVATYIPRKILNEVGLMDERFIDYGYDDNDMCERIRRAGYQLGCYDGCIFEHGDHKRSTYRSQPGLSLEPNKLRFFEKWGFEPGCSRSMERA